VFSDALLNLRVPGGADDDRWPLINDLKPVEEPYEDRHPTHRMKGLRIR